MKEFRESLSNVLGIEERKMLISFQERVSEEGLCTALPQTLTSKNSGKLPEGSSLKQGNHSAGYALNAAERHLAGMERGANEPH